MRVCVCVHVQMFQGFGDTGFHMSFGIGAFPFGFFATNFVNLGTDRGGQGGGPPEGSAQYEEEQFLHKARPYYTIGLR